MSSVVLVLNCGSSSLKYQVVDAESGEVHAHGLVERIGEHDSVASHHDALDGVLNDLDAHGLLSAVSVVGHRVVHGGEVFYAPTLIDDAVTAAIKNLSSLAPLHNPANLIGIEAAQARLGYLPQVAVFDTAFFHGLPPAAYTYAIDAAVAEQYGVRRYGFHGTSHEYVAHAAANFLGRPIEELNLIVFHLGNGASASAIRGGSPIDTSMGFTPLEGLVMGTRAGDIDAGVLLHLSRTAGFSTDELDRLLNRNSGLKGLCGVNDFRELMHLIDEGDEAARVAYSVYLHRLRKYLGAYLVALGRVDAVVFTAGVGENAATVRADALADLSGLGIEVDAERNNARASDIRDVGRGGRPVRVLVVPTNEELAIARASLRVAEL